MAVNIQKFLPSSSKSGSIVKVSKGLAVTSISETSQKNLGIVKVKVIEVDKLLKGTLAADKKELDDKKRESSKKRRENIETKLETKPSVGKGKVKMPESPRMGFLDWIKNFIGNIILGYFAVRLVDHLPKIIPIVKFIGKATDFIIDLGGKLLNGLVTFIDWGYKAYDATKGFAKNLFGETGAKEFDKLSTLLNRFLNLAIIAGMVAANSGGFGKGKMASKVTYGKGGKKGFKLPGTGPKVTTGKYVGGGPTRGGKVRSGVTRTISKKTKGKYKRRLPKKPGKVEITSVGADVGGENKLFGLFPNPIESVKKIMNPFGVIKKSGENLGQSDYFGPILAITSKILLGQKPSKSDYKNVGLGINLLISKGISDGKIMGGLAAAFEEGGFVDPKALEAIRQGGDVSDWVANSFREATETNAQKTLRNIQENLRLKSIESEMESEKGLKESDPNLDVGPGGTVTGGNADFWTLVAISSLESGNPQGRADVAQSIYNRLASGIYQGRTIKELVISGNGRQYQPVGRAVSQFKAISDKESAINAVIAANKLSRSQAEKFINDTASAIQNKDLQQNAAQFVGGRTDFWAEGLTPPSNGIGYVVRHGHRFGWFVGPAAIAYGKKNPGPAKAPQLGNIIVMGGITALGTGKISNVDSFTPIARKFGLTLTSSYRSGDPGYHGKNRARDYSNDAVGRGTPQQLAFAKHLVQNYGSSLTQLIYTPLGYGIANKKKVPLSYWGNATNRQHYHHVHVALKDGAMITEPTTALIGEGGKPEAVIGEKNTERIEEMIPGLLPAIVGAETKQQLFDTLRQISDYGFGPPDEIVIDSNETYGGESMMYSSSDMNGILFLNTSEEEDPFEQLYIGG